MFVNLFNFNNKIVSDKEKVLHLQLRDTVTSFVFGCIETPANFIFVRKNMLIKCDQMMVFSDDKQSVPIFVVDKILDWSIKVHQKIRYIVQSIQMPAILRLNLIIL